MLYMRRKIWGMVATFIAIVASTAAMAIGTYVRGWSALTLDGSWVIKYSEASAPLSLLVGGLGREYLFPGYPQTMGVLF